MKIKTSQSVHFLNSISLEDELNLINQPIDTKPKVVKNKAFGKCLQISSAQLINPVNLDYADYFYAAENQNSVFLSMMLLSADPFLNFLQNFKNKIPDTTAYPILSKFISAMENRDSCNIDKFIPFEGCTDIKEGYKFILKSIHQELIANMHFEEDAWNIQKKGKAFKIYPEYSPIVEIFQGKILEDVGEMKSGHFEVLKDIKVLQTTNCKKLPFVILVENYEDIEGYRPASFLTNDGALVVLSDNKGYEYKTEGFKVLENVEEVCENKENIKFILYTKTK